MYFPLHIGRYNELSNAIKTWDLMINTNLMSQRKLNSVTLSIIKLLIFNSG